MLANQTTVITDLKKDGHFTVGNYENRTFIILLMDDKDQSGEVKIRIKGGKAKVQILGLIIGVGGKKIDLYTLQDHYKPESVSDLLIKSVLLGNSVFNYRGLIRIEKDAQKSNAYQKNQNLLLSDKARADSRPYLEIEANDVRCTHGATVGRIDDDQLYYLKSRGISHQNAVKLLVRGHLNEVVERIPDEKARVRISGLVNNRLESLLSGMRYN